MSRHHHNLDGLFLGYLLGMNSGNRNYNDDGGGGGWLGGILFAIFIGGLFCGPVGWLVSFAIFCLGLVWLFVTIIIGSIRKRSRTRVVQENIRVATEAPITVEQMEARIIQDKQLKRKGNIALGVIITAVTAIAALASGSFSVWTVLFLIEVLVWGTFLYTEFA